MNPGTLLIRADAGAAVGSGHVMRCLALAQGWRRAGGEAVFAVAEATAAIEHRLADQSCRIARVSGAPGSRDDLYDTKARIAAESPAWIVLDGYRFDSAYREEIRQTGVPCLVVDDNGGNDCFASELVLNQNAHAAAEMYPQLAPHTRLLLGPRYAMLREEFYAYGDCLRETAERGKKILVTMGGSDPHDFAPRIIPHLEEQLEDDVRIRVVVGGSASHARSLEAQASASGERMQVLHDVRNMADMMAWADLAIAGAGSTCWEMCRLGLPAILVEAADNQKLLARKLDTMGVAVNAGPARQVDCAALAGRTRALLADPEKRQQMSQRGRSLVDGRGTERVLIFMNSGLRPRPAEVRDCRMLWEWANDPAVRSASFSEGTISWASHQQWFERQTGTAGARLYIIENGREAVGQVRYRIEGKRTTLSVNLAREYRGQGLGPKVLLLGIEELFNTTAVKTVDAYVKPENDSSLALFRSAGFEEKGVAEVEGQRAVWFVLKRWGPGE